MKLLRILGSFFAVLGLTAASCPQQQEEFNCINFNTFKHNDKFNHPLVVQNWWISSPTEFRMYDPSADDGPKESVGPEVDGAMLFFPKDQNKKYKELRINYISYNPSNWTILLHDEQGRIVSTWPAVGIPQNAVLKRTILSAPFSYIEINAKEEVIAMVCVL